MSFIDPTLLGGASRPSGSGSAPSTSASNGAATAGPSGSGDAAAATGEEKMDEGEGEGETEQVQEMHQKDQELAQFLLQLDHFQPLIPDPIISYHLSRVGFTSSDPRLKRLLALACQKFVADIAQDAFSFARTRAGQAPGGRQAGGGAAGAGPGGAGGQGQGSKKDRARTTLTQEDLAQALADFGINAHRAPYYL